MLAAHSEVSLAVNMTTAVYRVRELS